MSRKYIAYMILGVLLFLLNLMMAGGGDSFYFGNMVTIQERTMIAELLTSTDRYLNKEIRVEGLVEEVNKNSRCSFILRDEADDRICVQCSGCGYTLTNEQVGSKCIVQGILQKIKLENFDVGSTNIKNMSFSESSNLPLNVIDNEGYRYYLDSSGVILE